MADTTTPVTSSKATESRPVRAVSPAVDVYEDAAGITLLADMPGVPKDALEIHVDGETLTIAGTVTSTTPAGLRPVWAEMSAPSYRRTFALGRELDTAKIQANLKGGVLNLRIPKQEHAQPRRIEVSAD